MAYIDSYSSWNERKDKAVEDASRTKRVEEALDGGREEVDRISKVANESWCNGPSTWQDSIGISLDARAKGAYLRFQS